MSPCTHPSGQTNTNNTVGRYTDIQYRNSGNTPTPKEKPKVELQTQNTKTTRRWINITECDKDKANVLANLFSSMYTNEPERDLPTFKDANLEFEFEERLFEEKEFKKILNELNPNKSQGPDCLHPKALKDLKYVLAKPLTKISPQPTFCTTILVRKKARENDVNPDYDVTSGYDVTSAHVTDVTSGYDVTSAHVTDVTSGYDVTSTHVTDVTSGHITSGSTPFPHYDGLQVLKTVKY